MILAKPFPLYFGKTIRPEGTPDRQDRQVFVQYDFFKKGYQDFNNLRLVSVGSKLRCNTRGNDYDEFTIVSITPNDTIHDTIFVLTNNQGIEFSFSLSQLVKDGKCIFLPPY